LFIEISNCLALRSLALFEAMLKVAGGGWQVQALRSFQSYQLSVDNRM